MSRVSGRTVKGSTQGDGGGSGGGIAATTKANVQQQLRQRKREVSVTLQKHNRFKALQKKQADVRLRVKGVTTLSAGQQRERDSLTALVARLQPLLNEDEYVAILTGIISKHLPSGTEVEAVVLQTIENTSMVPTIVAMLRAGPSENLKSHLLYVLTNALSTYSTVLDEHAIQSGAVPLLVTIMSASRSVIVLERAVRCLANLVLGSAKIYAIVAQSNILDVILQIYRTAAPNPVPAKTGKIAKSPIAVNNRQLLCNISALLIAFDTHRETTAKLSLPLDFVKVMLQNWMNTVTTTKNTETLSNLLSVIYGNMQHHDITNHIVSKLDFTAHLITVISNRDTTQYAQYMALRVLSRITSGDMDVVYKVINMLVKRGFLEAVLPLIERKNDGLLASTSHEGKSVDVQDGVASKDSHIDSRQMDALLAATSCEVLSDIVTQGSGYLTHIFRAHLFEPLLILAIHGRHTEQKWALYTIMSSIQIASGSYQTKKLSKLCVIECVNLALKLSDADMILHALDALRVLMSDRKESGRTWTLFVKCGGESTLNGLAYPAREANEEVTKVALRCLNVYCRPDEEDERIRDENKQKKKGDEKEEGGGGSGGESGDEDTEDEDAEGDDSEDYEYPDEDVNGETKRMETQDSKDPVMSTQTPKPLSAYGFGTSDVFSTSSSSSYSQSSSPPTSTFSNVSSFTSWAVSETSSAPSVASLTNSTSLFPSSDRDAYDSTSLTPTSSFLSSNQTMSPQSDPISAFHPLDGDTNPSYAWSPPLLTLSPLAQMAPPMSHSTFGNQYTTRQGMERETRFDAPPPPPPPPSSFLTSFSSSSSSFQTFPSAPPPPPAFSTHSSFGSHTTAPGSTFHSSFPPSSSSTSSPPSSLTSPWNTFNDAPPSPFTSSLLR